MICSACGKDIPEGEMTCHGPSGVIHYTCFKRGTSFGQEIILISLSEEIDALKKRVQDLEEHLDVVARNTPFRIG